MDYEEARRLHDEGEAVILAEFEAACEEACVGGVQRVEETIRGGRFVRLQIDARNRVLIDLDGAQQYEVDRTLWTSRPPLWKDDPHGIRRHIHTVRGWLDNVEYSFEIDDSTSRCVRPALDMGIEEFAAFIKKFLALHRSRSGCEKARLARDAAQHALWAETFGQVPPRPEWEPETVNDPAGTDHPLPPVPFALLCSIRDGAVLRELIWNWRSFRLLRAGNPEERVRGPAIDPLMEAAFVERVGAWPEEKPRWMVTFDWRITDAGRAWLAANPTGWKKPKAAKRA